MHSQHSIAAREAAANTKAGDIPAALQHFDKLPDSATVGSDVVAGLYNGVTQVTLWRWVKAGLIPAPRKIGASRLNGWRVGELRAALAVKGADHAPA